MASDARQIDLDLLQFGATGFAGRLTAEYLARHAPAGMRWALAGRSRARLAQVADELEQIAPDRPRPELVEVSLDDQAAVDALVARAGVVLTTVGPFAEHGEPLVRAAARAGADYVDITGEPQFVDAMYLRYQEEAVASGARLVHCAGFDSVPHDLGAWFAARQLPQDGPIAVTGAVRANAQFSGGTFASALGAFAEGRGMQRLARERRQRERAAGRAVRPVKVVAGPPRRDPGTGRWLAPAPLIDPQIVVRSAATEPDGYGTSFAYDHRISTKRLATTVGLGVGAAGLLVAASISPVRRFLMSRVPAGTGPSAERRARSWFTVRFTGEGGGQRVVCEVSGGDPGYDETAKMVAETALALRYDDTPDRAGQLTTVAACGEALLARLEAAGIRFATVEGPVAAASA